jgi:hypothetical protein
MKSFMSEDVIRRITRLFLFLLLNYIGLSLLSCHLTFSEFIQILIITMLSFIIIDTYIPRIHFT